MVTAALDRCMARYCAASLLCHAPRKHQCCRQCAPLDASTPVAAAFFIWIVAMFVLAAADLSNG